jgi:hypothetical protein
MPPEPSHAEPHLKPVEPSRRPELTKLSTVATTGAKTLFREVLKKRGDKIVKVYDALERGAPTTNSPLEIQIRKARELVDRAGNYSLDLSTYWSHVLRFASDGYSLGGTGGSVAELTRLNGDMSAVNRSLRDQLLDFEKATSPHQRDYDMDEIIETGRKVLDTIGAAGQHLVAGMAGENLEAKGPAFRAAIVLGLSGLSEQIGRRMNELAAGRTPPAVTMSNQTRELVERSANDPPREQIAKEASAAAELIKNKDAYTADTLTSMLVRQLEIQEKLLDPGLRPQERQNLDTEQKKIGRSLALFNDFIDKAKTKGGDATKATRETLDESARKLRDDDIATKLDDPNLPLEEHAALIELLAKRADPLPPKLTDDDRTALVSKATKAAKDLLASFGPALKVAGTAQRRLQEYQKHVSGGKTGIGKNPAVYWESVKKTFLAEVKAVSGSGVRDALEKAFDRGFRKKLGDWNSEIEKPKLNAGELQGLATNLIETIDIYSKQAELALGKDSASLAIIDKLQAGLAAIRESVAERLKALFEDGAFN